MFAYPLFEYLSVLLVIAAISVVAIYRLFPKPATAIWVKVSKKSPFKGYFFLGLAMSGLFAPLRATSPYPMIARIFGLAAVIYTAILLGRTWSESEEDPNRGGRIIRRFVIFLLSLGIFAPIILAPDPVKAISKHWIVTLFENIAKWVFS